jgi:hypothetical protein
MVKQSIKTSSNTKGPKTLDELLELTQEFIHAIYKKEEIVGKKIQKIEWIITSNKLTTADHFENEKQRFSATTLQEAMQSFFNYLKEQKKI